LKELTPGTINPPTDSIKKSYYYQLNHFIGSVRVYHKPVSTVAEALKVADAIYKIGKKQKRRYF